MLTLSASQNLIFHPIPDNDAPGMEWFTQLSRTWMSFLNHWFHQRKGCSPVTVKNVSTVVAQTHLIKRCVPCILGWMCPADSVEEGGHLVWSSLSLSPLMFSLLSFIIYLHLYCRSIVALLKPSKVPATSSLAPVFCPPIISSPIDDCQWQDFHTKIYEGWRGHDA